MKLFMMKSSAMTVVLCLFISTAVCAAPQLPFLFSDGMVLQRNVNVPVWGSGVKPGLEVRVQFNGQQKKTLVDGEGEWKLYLDPMPALKKSANMTVTIGGETAVIHDVLVGEVWLASGQSNMQIKLEGLIGSELKTPGNQFIVDRLKKDIAESSDVYLRMLTVNPAVSPWTRQRDAVGHWRSADSPANTGALSGTAFYFAKVLRRELDVPVGVIVSAYGGTKIEAWIPESAYRSNKQWSAFYDSEIGLIKTRAMQWDKAAAEIENGKLMEQWEAARAENNSKALISAKPKLKISPDLNRQVPATLFNAMVAPVVPYAVKGMLWYQGEANANQGKNPETYNQKMSLLIEGFRHEWKDTSLPVYYVQLPGFGLTGEEPKQDKNWSTIRNQQRLALAIPKTCMVVGIDLGEANDIHPKNKIDIGERLSRCALEKTYSKNIGSYSGPLYKAAYRQGNVVKVNFTNTGSGLVTGKLVRAVDAGGSQLIFSPAGNALLSFQIAGEDGQWVDAGAKIVNGHCVEVSSPAVTAPVSLRYAWGSNPVNANLYNKAGLPASPFSVTGL